MRIVLENRGRILRNVLIHYSKHIFAFKWVETTEHLIENNSNCIDISTSCAALSTQLFGRHIIRGSNRPGKAAPGHTPCTLQQGNAKIDNLYIIIRFEHDILWLDISVVDSVL